MKKITKVFAVVAGLAAIFSCDKEIEVSVNPGPAESVDMVEMTIQASGLADEGSKTAISGNNVVWNTTGEYLKVFQDVDSSVVGADSSVGVTADEGATMTFGVSFEAASGTSFKYYAFYPKSALQSGQTLTSETSLESVCINTPASQTPTATSFDPAADLLIAKMVDNGGEQATSLNMQFARVVAVGKMTITNLGSDEDVKKVIFSAKQGSTSVNLAGRTAFDLTTAQRASEYGSYVGEKAIILDYSALTLKANSSMDAFFTCYPFDLVAGDSFTVEVQTENKIFTRKITLAGAQKLSFKAGTASRFSVNMSTAEETTVDLITLSTTGVSGGSYVDWSGKTVTTSAVYAGNSSASSGLIQLRNGYYSGIYTTASGGLISKLEITWGSTYSGNKVYLYGKNVPYNSSTELLDPASKGTKLGEISYGGPNTTGSIDNISGYYEYICILATGGTITLNQLKVYWKTDPNPRIDSPTNFSASATGSTINVSWTDVASGVSKYLVTCPDKKELQVNPGVQSVSFIGMADGTHKVFIRAIPSDLSTYSYSAVQSLDVVVAAEATALLTCDMTLKTANQDVYNTTTTYGSWVIKYGANHNGEWDYYKMGGRSYTIATYNPCEIYSTTAVTAAAAAVEVHLAEGSVTKMGMSVTSWGVEVYNNGDYAEAHRIDTAKGGGVISTAKGTYVFTPSDAYKTANSTTTWPSGCYYKVTWTLVNTSDYDGVICVDKITVYAPPAS